MFSAGYFKFLQKHEGHFFDVAVILGAVFFERIVATFFQTATSNPVRWGFTLLSVVVLYGVGVYVKRPFLFARLKSRPPSKFMRTLFGLQTVAAFFVLFAALVPIIPWDRLDITKEGSGILAYLFTGLLFLTLMMLLIWWSSIPRSIMDARRPIPARSWHAYPSIEFLGNVFILIFVIVAASLWQNVLAPRYADVTNTILTQIKSGFFDFSVFYLAPRSLFLVEDYREPLTWVTMGLTAVSFMRQIFV
ncbi:MAG: hypothetical protein Q7S89_03280 [bacterium]|nr:hypothetical protein [bacterium]